MWPYFLKRLAGAIPTLFILATLVFFLQRTIPGGPFDTDHALPDEVKANILRNYELDQPITTQYFHFLRDVSRGDLHESFEFTGKPVTQVIRDSFLPSLILGSLSLFFAIVLGVPLGCLAVLKRGTFWDTSAMFVAISGISLPTFLLASILVLVFSVKLDWLPPALWESPKSLILPVITLALRPLSIIARLIRASLIESERSDYMRTAYGKGLSETRALVTHALKNSIIPVITITGPLAANLVTGSFLAEMVFQLPGLGRHFVQAVLNRDYPLVMGVTLTYGVILILCNIAVDLVYRWADPRIRVEQ
jgi:oligopeptide transport system permease protein